MGQTVIEGLIPVEDILHGEPGAVCRYLLNRFYHQDLPS
jgi:hypothetical protein